MTFHSRLLPALLMLFLAACQSQPPQHVNSTARPHPADAGTITAPAYTSYPPPYPVPPTSTEAPYQPPIYDGTPRPTSTRVQLTPTPTFASTLVSPVEITRPARLPQDISLQVFDAAWPIQPSYTGYEDVLAVLKEKSFFYHQELSSYGNAAWLAAINQKLAPFGYQVRQTEADRIDLSLYQGEKLLLDHIRIASHVSVNRSKTDFVMFVELMNAKPGYLLVRKDGLEPLSIYRTGLGPNEYNMQALPQYIGDDLIYPRMSQNGATGRTAVDIYRSDLLVYQAKGDGPNGVVTPLHGFWTYHDSKGDHWSLEIRNQIYIDGKSVNERYGYQESYAFSLPGGRPVFMFEKDGQFGLNINGVEVPLPGTSVIHYVCCDTGFVGPGLYDQGLRFFIRNGDRWIYVEMVVR